MFTSSPASLNAATATSLVFLVAGMLAVASSLQQIYEKVFHQDHRGLRDLYRLVIWIAVLRLAVVSESVAERPTSSAPGGGWLAPLVTVAIMTWLIAIGTVIILGAVAGAAWDDRRNRQIRRGR